mmetsp:Transcript_5925/g.16589  ORF Transcript_5925/g.16589 Transcript_5925/m.16589 type:complete len:476 (+) Transcript_5925:166-1593(+)
MRNMACSQHYLPSLLIETKPRALWRWHAAAVPHGPSSAFQPALKIWSPPTTACAASRPTVSRTSAISHAVWRARHGGAVSHSCSAGGGEGGGAMDGTGLRPVHPMRTTVWCSACSQKAACVSSAHNSEHPPGGLELKLSRWASVASQMFPLWVVSGAILGLMKPAWFLWFSGDWVVWGLALTMIGMGTCLEAEDFKRLLQTPWTIGLGVLLQYTVMPSIGAGLAHFAGLPKAFAVGLVLVACCPGGTASNIVSFLARADVALSVGMTTVSTLLAAVTTPLLTQLAVGTIVPVDVMGLLTSTCQVVLLPVVIGSALNHFFPKQVARTRPFSPLVAVVTVAMICASVVAAQAAAVLSCGPQLVGCVFLLHAGGFALGYLLPKLLTLPEPVSRTISIEVGMQNSTLGSMLAALHFASLPGAPAPGAISACMHSVLGSALAGLWRAQDDGKPDGPSTEDSDGKEAAAAWIQAWRERQSG